MSKGTDDPFYKLMKVGGEAILKFIGVASPEEYESEAIVLKDRKLYPDIVSIPKSGDSNDRVFIEFQGYAEPMIRYSAIAKIAMTCDQKNYTGSVLGAIIYTDKIFQDVALPMAIESKSGEFKADAKFKEIVLSNYTTEELLRIDPRLIILAPFTLPKSTRKSQLRQICRKWSQKISTAYPETIHKNILEILGLFILNRFGKLSLEEVIIMLNFDLAKTKAGKQLINMGIEKGLQKGEKKGLQKGERKGERKGIHGMQDMLLKAAAVKWNSIPKDIESMIKTIYEMNILKSLIGKLVQSGSINDFRNELLKICEEQS